jgi:hypothetical protein
MSKTRKLIIYDADLSKETKSIMAKDNWFGQLEALNKLRQYAKDKSICGWINEYDLNWSNTQCANKHEL